MDTEMRVAEEPVGVGVEMLTMEENMRVLIKKEHTFLDVDMKMEREPTALDLSINSVKRPVSDIGMVLRREATVDLAEEESVQLQRKSCVSEMELQTHVRKAELVETVMSVGTDLSAFERSTVIVKQEPSFLESDVSHGMDNLFTGTRMSINAVSRGTDDLLTGTRMSINDVSHGMDNLLTGTKMSIGDVNRGTDHLLTETRMSINDMSHGTDNLLTGTRMSIKTEPIDWSGDVHTTFHESMKSEPSLCDTDSPYHDRGEGSDVQSEQSDVKEESLQDDCSVIIKLEPEETQAAEEPVPLCPARVTNNLVSVQKSDAGLNVQQKLVIKLKHRIAGKSRVVTKKRNKCKSKLGYKCFQPVLGTDTSVVVPCQSVPRDNKKLSGDQEAVTGSSTVEKKHSLTNQKTRKRGKSHVCSHCQQLFCSRSSLKRHYKRKHSDDNPRYSCQYCDVKFTQLVQARAHERMHRGGEKTFPCQECDVVFTRACHLRVHMRKHTGERPYSCEDCKATFRTTSNLNRHMMKHSGLRPYICTVCNADFYQSSHLVSHIRKHTGERPFSCTKCEATFTQLTHLHRHTSKHTGVKPYVCSQCGMGFVENCALKKHLQSHTSEAQLAVDPCKESNPANASKSLTSQLA